MAYKRRRDHIIEWTVKSKEHLAKPIFITLNLEKETQPDRWAQREAEMDAYVEHLEALVRLGQVPEEFHEQLKKFTFIGDVIGGFLKSGYVPSSDVACLNVLYARIGTIALRNVDYAWVETWIDSMKQFHNLAPSTIRHHVGALARCFDWASRKKIAGLVINPIRLLPKRYATYTEADRRQLETRNAEARKAGGAGRAIPRENERDRRLAAEEEKEIRRLLEGGRPRHRDGGYRERALAAEYRPAHQCMFDLALESAMRMKEMYSLGVDQVDIGSRTIFLEKTKNGSKRQVPLTTVAIAALNRYYEAVTANDPSMGGFTFDGGMLFPFWTPDPQQRPEMDRLAFRKISSRLSVMWGNLFEAAGAEDLHFHDLRHEATARLFIRTRLRDTEIAKITGHKDMRMLARYANLRASELADMLW
jgi:integrase